MWLKFVNDLMNGQPLRVPPHACHPGRDPFVPPNVLFGILKDCAKVVFI